MKKFFIAVVVSLLAICFSEEFNGFLGIEWGTERKACLEAMTVKGWYSYGDDLMHFAGKTYGGRKTVCVLFQFDEDRLVSIGVLFPYPSDSDKVFDALIKKIRIGWSGRKKM